ncbi:MAG: DUF819 family protein [Deltaproteobacteria bacterium]|nr:DUF819 family protein [Deltaproteobacteria bacterium]
METQALVNDPTGFLMVFFGVPALIFWLEEKTPIKKLFKVIPALAFLCIVPSLMVGLHIIPAEHPFYGQMKSALIAPTMVLLTMTADIKGIFKLGPKLIVMFFSGTLGVFCGAILTFVVFHNHLPPDAWRGLTALSASWIGGLGNFMAVGTAVGASDSIMGLMMIVDLVLPSIWLTCLFYCAGQHKAIDKMTGADTSAIEELKHKMIIFQRETQRTPTVSDYAAIIAIAFSVGYVSMRLGGLMPAIGKVITAQTWTIIICTTIGLFLSTTKVRRLDGVGASKIGTLLIYILIAVIGSGANFKGALQYPLLLMMGALWMLVHITFIVIAMRLLKAPVFFAAVGSQANIGGTASTPIVASAFHPSLASVGFLTALCGTLSGNYVALLVGVILEWMDKVL